MRWPFHFGRREAAEVAPAAPPRRRDWAALPPIQRAIGEPALTAPTPEFIDSLAGARDPDLSLQPLGHHVSLEAPHGLVVARSVESYAPSTELVGRPRARGATTVARLSADAEPGLRLPEQVIEPADELVEIEPPRSLAAVEPLAPSPAPLTRLADADQARAAMMAPTAAVQTSRRQTEESRPEPAAADTAAMSPVPPPAVQRMTLGQSRRLGLGAPLTSPAVPAAQRASVTSRPPDLSTALRPITPEAKPVGDSPPTGMTQTRPPTAEIANLVDLPLARAAARHVTSSEVPDSAPAGPEAAFVTHPESSGQRAEGGDETTIEHSIQRVIARSLPPLFPRPAAGGMATAPLAPARTILRPAAAPAFDQATAAVPVQLMPPTPSEPAHVAMQYGAAIPSPLAVKTPVAQPMLEPATVAPPPRPTLPALPLVQRLSAPAPVLTEPGGFEAPVEITTAFAAGGAPGFVQRAVTAGESPEPAPEAPASPAPAPPSGPSAGAVPPPTNENELAELARKLYEPITARLRRELLVDRERAGMITDLR